MFHVAQSKERARKSLLLALTTTQSTKAKVLDGNQVATVLEMARQLADIVNQTDNPKGLSDSAHGVVKRKVWVQSLRC